MKDRDEKYMRECFQLAKKALGKTSPNPLVGCVIVKDQKVIARGYHKKSGLPHAEIEALNSSKEPIAGSTLYCNLEPCCHTNKKTPPCAQRLVQEKPSRVVIANLDPNPEVAGKGVKLLRENGIEVLTGVLEEQGELLNEVFFTAMRKQRPFIHLKWAQGLDGRTALPNGSSKWITGEKARLRVHKERELYDAIVIGKKTFRRR